jgi:hypothetical protein
MSVCTATSIWHAAADGREMFDLRSCLHFVQCIYWVQCSLLSSVVWTSVGCRNSCFCRESNPSLSTLRKQHHQSSWIYVPPTYVTQEDIRTQLTRQDSCRLFPAHAGFPDFSLVHSVTLTLKIPEKRLKWHDTTSSISHPFQTIIHKSTVCSNLWVAGSVVKYTINENKMNPFCDCRDVNSSIELQPSWEADSFSALQEKLDFYETRNFISVFAVARYFFFFLSDTNPFDTILSCFFIHVLISPSRLRLCFSNPLLPSTFRHAERYTCHIIYHLFVHPSSRPIW